jgi:hypothetical protein
MTTMLTRPDRTEAADYYFTYVDRVPPDADVLRLLEDQLPATVKLLEGISDDQSLHRYAPGKWSIREVVSHLNDTERLFVFRAMWFARGLEPALPSFDQDVALAGAYADERPWRQHIDEFRAVRAASLAFFKHLRDDVWTRRGVASGNPFSVRALAYITAGHVSHHTILLRERYL